MAALFMDLPTYIKYLRTHGQPNAVVNATTRDSWYKVNAAHGSPVPGSPQATQQPPAAGAVGPDGKPTVQTQPGPPAPFQFDPNNLDAQGINDLGALNNEYGAEDPNNAANPWGGTYLAAAHRSFAKRTADLSAARPEIERGRDEGLRTATNNAAARHMFNSGNRIVNQNKVNVGADSALAANQRDVDDATAELAGARQVASNQRTTGTAGIQASTAARQGATYVDNWRRTNNIGA